MAIHQIIISKHQKQNNEIPLVNLHKVHQL